MQENTIKIIGVCVADISTDYNDRFFEAFKRLAHDQPAILGSET